MDSEIFYAGWTDLAQVALLGLCAYAVMLVFLRVSGKRTLTKLNVFDFIFVVALGSIVADTILTPGTTLARGAVAMAVLIGLQLVISFVASRSRRVESVVNGRPELLVLRGEFLEACMRKHRLTKAELLSAIRGDGIGLLSEVEAVVLETDGSLSVVRRIEDHSGPTTLSDVEGYHEPQRPRDPASDPRPVASVPR